MPTEERDRGADVDDEMLAVTTALIASSSINPPGDERAAVEVVKGLLAERGIAETEVLARRPERPNLIARIGGGAPGPTLMLCGHLDTKPPGILADWETEPFTATVRDGRLYGLGACDMKGGVAAIIVAAGRIARAGGPPRGELLLAFTADEEGGSTEGAHWLAAETGVRADAAIITEAAGIDRDWEMLALGCRGGALFRVDVTGRTGHTALADRDGGVTATMAAARLMDRFDRKARELPGVAVNVGATMEGGVSWGVRAPSASFRCDIRFAEPVSAEQIFALLDELIEDYRGRHPEVEVTYAADEIAGSPYIPTGVEPDSDVAVACRQAFASVLGAAPPDATFPAATDSLFLHGLAGIPTVPAFGPGRLREAHRPNEYVSLKSLSEAPVLLEAAALNYLGS